MKKLFTTLIICIMATSFLFAARNPHGNITVKGRACDQNDRKIDYATVVFISRTDSARIHGIVSDTAGRFTLNIPRGGYRMEVSFIGYEKITREVELDKNTDLGDIALKESSVGIEAVVVRGELITHEADRFIVNVANSPMAIGKTADEMLALAPGVWVRDGISINGKSDTRVMVNNRLLRETGEDLVTYLNTIKAEDIARIEVIPNAGTEYDADMGGGIVKITLKRQRNNGINGSLSIRYSHATDSKQNSTSPSFTFNLRANKLNLYSGVNFGNGDYTGRNEDYTRFNSGDEMRARSSLDNDNNWRSARLGAIYDITPHQSVGVEGEISRSTNGMPTDSYVDRNENGNRTEVASDFLRRDRNDRIGLAANYILSLDTVGSTFKLLADYNKRIGGEDQDYHSRYTGFQTFDTIYRGATDNRNTSASAAAYFEIRTGKTGMLKTGAKYTFNRMDNATLYEYYKADQWHTNLQRTSLNQYDENIAALYADYSNKFRNGLSIGFGLRTEYTYAVPATSSTVIKDKQKYWGFFPNANISVPLNEKKSHILTLNYNRRIRRPSFWQLNPYRNPLSEFTFMEGNPKLKPSYRNDLSLRWLIAQKYSVTLQYNATDNATDRVATEEPGGIIVYRYENISRNSSYSVNVNVPANITKWWYLNGNVRAGRIQTRIQGSTINSNALQANISNTFTIAEKYYLDLQGFYMAGMLQGNLKFKPIYQINASLKRNFAKNRFTVSIFANDLFNSVIMKADIIDSNFSRNVRIQENWRNIGMSFRYNFKAGQNIKVKKVESAAGEDKERL